jgi:hypothetical protein
VAAAPWAAFWQKLGVPFYDKAVIKTLQEKYHFDAVLNIK